MHGNPIQTHFDPETRAAHELNRFRLYHFRPSKRVRYELIPTPALSRSRSSGTGYPRFNCDKEAKRVKALVYLGSKDKALQERPKPGIIPASACRAAKSRR